MFPMRRYKFILGITVFETIIERTNLDIEQCSKLNLYITKQDGIFKFIILLKDRRFKIRKFIIMMIFLFEPSFTKVTARKGNLKRDFIFHVEMFFNELDGFFCCFKLLM